MHRIEICAFFFLSGLIASGFSRRDNCPEVKPMKNFNIFEVLGPWFVVQYYSSAEIAFTYHCMQTEFGLSNGNMDMKMRLTYKYAADPLEEMQTGNITWQIPDPMRPEHWRHTEDHYKGVYNTDVLDTDHSSWMILLHCSDPESEKKFLSTFILSRTPYMDKLTMDYLREKVTAYGVNLDYLFPVNQTFCHGEQYYAHSEQVVSTTTTTVRAPSTPAVADDDEEEQDLYFAEDSLNNNEDGNNNDDEGLDGEELSPIASENSLHRSNVSTEDDTLKIYPE